jgi:hypothetical protein
MRQALEHHIKVNLATSGQAPGFSYPTPTNLSFFTYAKLIID